MKTPYSVLLSLRQAEEKHAEVALAAARQAADERERALEAVRAAETAWIALYVGDAAASRELATLSGMLTSIKRAERDAESRFETAQRRLDQARDLAVEAQRRRRVVEQLHEEAVAAAERAEAKRAQAELDELAAIRVRHHAEGARAG